MTNNDTSRLKEFPSWLRARLPIVHNCQADSINIQASLAPRYEALFRVSDCLRSHRDIEGLFRVLPHQLHPAHPSIFRLLRLTTRAPGSVCRAWPPFCPCSGRRTNCGCDI
jgi:hypothetical protein